MTEWVTVEYIVGATTYTLCGRDPYGFISLTGVGNPPVRRQKERGPQQNGSTDVGYTLDERVLNMALIITGATKAEVAASRRDLAHILKPSTTAGKLRLTSEDSQIRQVDCNVIGMVDFANNDQARIGASQIVIVQFEAANPIAYDPTLQNIIFDAVGNSGGVTVPIMIPWAYDASTDVDAYQLLAYDGDWEAFPVIYLTGAMTDPIITNDATGKVIDLTGTTIDSGDTWTIDLSTRPATVTDADGALQNGAVTDASDLATWSILPDPEAVGGNNPIHVTASGVDSNVRIRIEFYRRFPSLE